MWLFLLKIEAKNENLFFRSISSKLEVQQKKITSSDMILCSHGVFRRCLWGFELFASFLYSSYGIMLETDDRLPYSVSFVVMKEEGCDGMSNWSSDKTPSKLPLPWHTEQLQDSHLKCSKWKGNFQPF